MPAFENFVVDTVVAEGVEARYMRVGSGNKTMLVIPGVSMFRVTDSAPQLAPAFEIFLKEYTVYLVDVRENIPEGYTLKEMAEDTVKILLALGLKDIYLYGASMGGTVSGYIAGTYPELIKKVLFASSMCKSNAISDATFSEWINLAIQRNGVSLGKSFAEHVYSEKTCEQNMQELLYDYDRLSEEDFCRFVRVVQVLNNFDFTEIISKIRCPCMVLGSYGDRTLGVEAVQHLALTCGAELYLYDSTYGHAVYAESPDFFERILNFF